MNATHRAWWDDYCGIPYIPLGRTREPGFDCWGLVRFVKREREGVDLPSLASYSPADRAETIARESERWADVTAAPRPGDVAVFRTNGHADHVALIVAPGLMLHVVEGGVSHVVRMDHPLWRRRLVSVWRYGAGTVGVAPGLVTLQAQAGDTVLSLIVRAGVDPERCLVSVAGRRLPRSMWGLCRPASGAPVEMRRMMAGGDSGKLVASLAVMAVAWYAAPALMGYAAGSAGWAAAGAAGSAWTVAAANAGLNIVGNMLVSKIFPTRTGMASPSSGDAVFALQGGSNSAHHYGAVPVVLGRYRYTPPLGATTYTEAVGQDVYLRMVLVWGYGPLVISNIRIGDTPIESYSEVEIETLEGSPDDSAESKAHFDQIYSVDVAQENVGITLEAQKYSVSSASRLSGVVTVTTSGDHDVSAGDFVKLYKRTAGYMTYETNDDGELVGTFHPEVITLTAQGYVTVLPATNKLQFNHAGLDGAVQAATLSTWSYVTRIIDSDVDRIRVTLNFAQGLFGLSSDDGTTQSRSVDVSIAVRPSTGGPWGESTSIVRARSATLGRAWYNTDSDAQLEKVYRWSRVSISPTNAIVIKHGAFTSSQYSEPSGALLSRLQAESYGFDVVYTRLPPEDPSHEPLYLVCVYGDAILQVVDQRQSGDGGVTGCALTYSGRVISIAAGTVLRTQEESITIAGAEKTAFSKNVEFFVPRGRYEVRVARTSANANSEDQTIDACTLTTITGYTNTRPIKFEKPLAMTAIKIRASNQISGQVDGILGTVQSVCKDWDSATSSWVERPTRNPASLFRFVLQHPANARRLADSRINLGELQDWHVYCQQSGFTFDMVVSAQRSLEDVLRDIAAAGRASPTWRDGKRSVVIDRLKTGYSAYFTPHNSWGFESVRSLPAIPHGWRVQFANAEKSYQPDERIVYSDGYSAGNATLIEGLDLPGVTSPALVHKHARFHFAQLRLRPETYTLNTDWEHLVVTRGDLVRVTHDVTMWGVGSARIKSIGGDLQTVQLDTPLPMSAGVTYQCRIRLTDGTSVLRNVTPASSPGFYSSLHLVADLPDGAAAGCLVMFGEVGQEGADLIVTGIEPQDGHSARLTLVDYAPACQDSDAEAVPDFDSQITLPPSGLQVTITQKPTVTGVISDERVMRRLGPGKYEYALRVAYSSPKKLPRAVTHVQARFDRVDGVAVWKTVTVPIEAGQATIRPVEERASYKFQLRYLDVTGRAGPWSDLQTHAIVGKTNRPASVVGVQAAPSGARLKIKWDANREPDVEKYEVRTSPTGWGANDSERVFYGAATSCFHVPGGVGAITYYVKARDGGGLWSKTPASVTYTYSAPSAPASLTASFSDTATTSAQVVLDWPDASPAFGVGDYVVYQAGSKIKTAKASTITLPANWVGSRTFGVSVRDALGVESAQRTLVVTMTLPGTPPAPVQDATAAVAGKTTVTLDWDASVRGTLAIAGYEVRQTDSGWGGTGAVYRGSGSKAVIPGVSTTATTTWYIRAFDTEQHYSASSRVVTHDVTRPGNVGTVSVSRSGATLTLTASGYSKPADFRVFEFQIGRAPADVPSSGDFWDDPDAVKIQTSAATTSVGLTRFNAPRMSASGVTYRVAARMVDTSGNTSPASALASILVRTL